MPLDDDPKARNTDPDTSHEAAESLDPTKTEAAICAAYGGDYTRGMIWDEIVVATQLRPSTVSPRLKAMRKKGILEYRENDEGQVIQRPAVTNRNQKVHFLKRPDVS